MTAAKRKYSLLSLYTGAGGLDIGFEMTSRFETAICIEKEKVFAETLRINQKSKFIRTAKIVEEDVASLEPTQLLDELLGGTSPDGIIGGPPCQSFSVRGKRLGLKDPRALETFRFVEWVAALRPRFFLMENVPRMLTLDDGKILKRILGGAKKCGYATFHAVLNAADYGSATKRKRAFVVGILPPDSFAFPEPTHSPDGDANGRLRKHVASESVLAGLASPGYEKPGVPQGHIGVRHTPPVRDRFDRLRPGQQDNIRKRTRLDPLRPSPTLVAGDLHEIRSHIHPREPRELTNRESARLHGFSDDFEFAGNHAAMGKQVANSVPIPLAQALGAALAKALDEGSCKGEAPQAIRRATR